MTGAEERYYTRASAAYSTPAPSYPWHRPLAYARPRRHELPVPTCRFRCFSVSPTLFHRNARARHPSSRLLDTKLPPGRILLHLCNAEKIVFFFFLFIRRYLFISYVLQVDDFSGKQLLPGTISPEHTTIRIQTKSLSRINSILTILYFNVFPLFNYFQSLACF